MLEIYTDGSCICNGTRYAQGGWAYVVVKDNKIIHQEFGKLREGIQDNNRAEMEALIQALYYIDSISETVIIYSDSETVVNCINGDAKRRLHFDMWNEISYIISRNIKKIKAVKYIASKSSYNLIADELAKKGANSLLIAPINLIKKEVEING